MANIITVDNLEPLDETVENFPALKYAFTYDGCDFDAGTITCPVSGLVLTQPILQERVAATYSITGIPTVTGSLVAPGNTKNVIMCYIAEQIGNETKGFALGDPANSPGFGVAPNGLSVGFLDYVTVTASKYSTLKGYSIPNDEKNVVNALAINWADDQTKEAFISSSLPTVQSGNGTSSGTGGITAGISSLAGVTLPNNKPNSSTEITNLYGCYVLYFDNKAPLDLENAVVWMQKHKRLYPGWAFLK